MSRVLMNFFKLLQPNSSGALLSLVSGRNILLCILDFKVTGMTES